MYTRRPKNNSKQFEVFDRGNPYRPRGPIDRGSDRPIIEKVPLDRGSDRPIIEKGPLDRGSDRPIIEKGPLDRGSYRPMSDRSILPGSIGPFSYRPRVQYNDY